MSLSFPMTCRLLDNGLDDFPSMLRVRLRKVKEASEGEEFSGDTSLLRARGGVKAEGISNRDATILALPLCVVVVITHTQQCKVRMGWMEFKKKIKFVYNNKIVNRYDDVLFIVYKNKVS